MLLNLFIGDVQFEYIAKYPVKGIKLKVSALGREFFLSADWTKPTRIVRFQQTVHLQCPDDGDCKVPIALEVLAVNCDDYPEKETLLGSGHAIVSPEDHAVGQVVQVKGTNGKALLARVATTAFFYVYPIDVAEDPQATKAAFLKGNKSKEYAFLLSRRLNWQEGKPASFDDNLESILSNDVSKNLIAIHKDLHGAGAAGGSDAPSTSLPIDELLQGTKHFSALKAKRVDIHLSDGVKAMRVSIGSRAAPSATGGHMTPDKLRKKRLKKRAEQEAAVGVGARVKKVDGEDGEPPRYMSARRSSLPASINSNGGSRSHASSQQRRASSGVGVGELAQLSAELTRKQQEAEERRLALAKLHHDRVKLSCEEKSIRADAVKKALEQTRKANEKMRLMLERKEAELRAVEEKIAAERERARQLAVNSRTVPRSRADEVINKQPSPAPVAVQPSLSSSPSAIAAARSSASPFKSRLSMSPSQQRNSLLFKSVSPHRASTGTLIDPVILTRPSGRASTISLSVGVDENVRAQVPLSAFRQRPKSAPRAARSSESLASAIKRLTVEERRLMQAKRDEGISKGTVTSAGTLRSKKKASGKPTSKEKPSVEEIRRMQQKLLEERAQAILAAAEAQPDAATTANATRMRVKRESLAHKPSLEEIRRKQEKQAQEKAMAILAAMETRAQLPPKSSRRSSSAEKTAAGVQKPSLDEIRRRQEQMEEERARAILAAAEQRAQSVPKERNVRKKDLWGEPMFSSSSPAPFDQRRSLSVSASVSKSKQGQDAVVIGALEEVPKKRSSRPKSAEKSRDSQSLRVAQDANGRASITLHIPTAPLRAIRPSKPASAPTGRPIPHRYSRDSSMIVDDLPDDDERDFNRDPHGEDNLILDEESVPVNVSSHVSAKPVVAASSYDLPAESSVNRQNTGAVSDFPATSKPQVRRSRKSSRVSSATGDLHRSTAPSGTKRPAMTAAAASAVKKGPVKKTKAKSKGIATDAKKTKSSHKAASIGKAKGKSAATTSTTIKKKDSTSGDSVRVPRAMTNEELLALHARMVQAANIAKGLNPFRDEFQFEEDSLQRMKHNLDDGFDSHPELVTGAVDSDDDDEEEEDDDEDEDQLEHGFLDEHDGFASESYGTFQGRIDNYTINHQSREHEYVHSRNPLNHLEDAAEDAAEDMPTGRSGSDSFPSGSGGIDSFLNAPENGVGTSTAGALSMHISRGVHGEWPNESKVGPVSAREESGDSEMSALVDIIEQAHIHSSGGRKEPVRAPFFSSSSSSGMDETGSFQPASPNYQNMTNSPQRQVQGLSFRRSLEGTHPHPYQQQSPQKAEAEVRSLLQLGSGSGSKARVPGETTAGVTVSSAVGDVSISIDSGVGDSKGWYWRRADEGEGEKGELPDLDESIESLPMSESVAASDGQKVKRATPEGKLGSFSMDARQNESLGASPVIVEQDSVTMALDQLQARVHELTSKSLAKLDSSPSHSLSSDNSSISYGKQGPHITAASPVTYRTSPIREPLEGADERVLSRVRASSQTSQELSGSKYDWVGRVMPDEENEDEEEEDEKEEEGEEEDAEGDSRADEEDEEERVEVYEVGDREGRQSLVVGSSSTSEAGEQSEGGEDERSDTDADEDSDDGGLEKKLSEFVRKGPFSSSPAHATAAEAADDASEGTTDEARLPEAQESHGSGGGGHNSASRPFYFDGDDDEDSDATQSVHSDGERNDDIDRDARDADVEEEDGDEEEEEEEEEDGDRDGVFGDDGKLNFEEDDVDGDDDDEEDNGDMDDFIRHLKAGDVQLSELLKGGVVDLAAAYRENSMDFADSDIDIDSIGGGDINVP